ncbi:hypothetical protein DXG01_010967 [Tephrocybe rancida]|nr:hypothetical protein DXG01_010967 [Tephrocybe rancida]
MTISRTAHDSLKQDIFERSIDSWLETYTTTPQLHPRNRFVNDVKASIPQDVLNNEGWQSIITSTKAGRGEDSIYVKLPEVSTAIINAVKKVDPSFRTTNFPPGTNQQTYGCQLDICVFPKKPHISCYTIGEYDVPSNTPVARLLAQSPRGATQQPTADCELAQDIRRIVAIAPSRAHDCVKFDEFKICEGATKIMYRDPRRRFIFAFTVDGDMASLWNFNRGHVCRSEPFNLHKEPQHLIRFLLFLSSATAEQLGYDPTIIRHLVDSLKGKKLISYEYTVEGKSYLTEGNPISESAAYHLISRATRVWEAREISGKGEKPLKLSNSCYVLKDAWQYSDRRLEQDIQKDIFKELKDIDDEGNTNHATEAKNYFMTIMHDWRVESNGISDTSFELPTGHQNTSFTCIERKLAKTLAADSQRSSMSARDSTRHSHSTQNSTPHPDLKHHTHSHVRTVYAEVCYSMYELSDYKTVFLTLKDIVTGLNYLRMAGFVHRDISAGNCLWSLEGNRSGGKISDLERTRFVLTLTKGTPSFMAVEYQQQRHLFSPRRKPSYKPFECYRMGRKSDRKRPIRPSFRFNFYHDLESVFWIYVYFLHHLFPMNSVPTDDESLDDIAQSARQRIYCGIQGAMLRTMVITDGDTIEEIAAMLENFFPNHLHLLSALGFACNMAESYAAVQSSQPVIVGDTPQYWSLESFTDDPYKKIISLFQRILNLIVKHSNVDGDVPALLLDLHSRKREATRGGEEQGRAKKSKGETSSLR